MEILVMILPLDDKEKAPQLQSFTFDIFPVRK